MSPVGSSGSEETTRFHQIVETGSLVELRVALENGADANAPGRIGMTPLMVAIAATDLEKMRLLVEHGADPELADDFNMTPLRHAVGFDFEEGVRFLLSLNSIKITGGEVHRVTEGGEHEIVANEAEFDLKLSTCRWLRR